MKNQSQMTDEECDELTGLAHHRRESLEAAAPRMLVWLRNYVDMVDLCQQGPVRVDWAAINRAARKILASAEGRS